MPHSLAPTDIALHPAQLYSALGLFAVFLFMYFYARHRFTQPGQQTMLNLMLVSTERFITDFWRGDREMVSTLSNYGVNLSFHQLLALGIIIVSGILFVAFSYSRQRQRT